MITVRTLGLFEAKQKLSEIVERAAEGEHIGITRRGKLAAVVVPAQHENNLKDVFEDIERTRIFEDIERTRKERGGPKVFGRRTD